MNVPCEYSFFIIKSTFLIHFGDGGGGKAYLLYTCENVDNCEQPLSQIEFQIFSSTLGDNIGANECKEAKNHHHYYHNPTIFTWVDYHNPTIYLRVDYHNPAIYLRVDYYNPANYLRVDYHNPTIYLRVDYHNPTIYLGVDYHNPAILIPESRLNLRTCPEWYPAITADPSSVNATHVTGPSSLSPRLLTFSPNWPDHTCKRTDKAFLFTIK